MVLSLSKRRAASARIGLFVEGTLVETPAGRVDLAELWKDLWAAVGGIREAARVVGFTKQQLVLMAEQGDQLVALKVAGKIPFDALVAVEHSKQPFDRLVVAFDAFPANQKVVEIGQGSCLRTERDFVLERLAASTVLPVKFKSAAAKLRQHYEAHRNEPRARQRPPFGDVEIVYMEPCFESLVVSDRAALLGAFGYERTPADWPKAIAKSGRPDMALAKLVDTHRKRGPTYLRASYASRRHAWSHEIVRKADKNSALWGHPIAARLALVTVEAK